MLLRTCPNRQWAYTSIPRTRSRGIIVFRQPFLVGATMRDVPLVRTRRLGQNMEQGARQEHGDVVSRVLVPPYVLNNRCSDDGVYWNEEGTCRDRFFRELKVHCSMPNTLRRRTPEFQQGRASRPLPSHHPRTGERQRVHWGHCTCSEQRSELLLERQYQRRDCPSGKQR